MDLRWRTVVVTGGAAGLGREIALRFGWAGSGVVVADRDADGAEETAALVRECRVQAWPLAVDLCDDDELLLLAGRVRDLGGADVLVNNAGGWTPGPQFPEAGPAGTVVELL